MVRSVVCGAHVHDSLVPIERHHVWPLGYHGPNTKDNIVELCCNAHSDVHYLLERLLKTGDNVPWEEERTYGRGVRVVAQRGYLAVMAYSATLSPEG